MDNERDRRDWPNEDRGDQPPEPDPTSSASSADDPSRPLPMDETTPEGASSTDAWGGPTGTSAEPTDAEGWRNPEQPERVVDDPSHATVAPSGATASGDPGTASSEIESWPSQEASGSEPAAAETRPWPTEPPFSGSAADDAWPTSAPEGSDDAVAEPVDESGWTSDPAAPSDEGRADESRWATEEPAPEEVEAHPASGASAGDAAAAAAAAPAPAHAVPDAEGATGESTQCPRCGTENRPGLSFCRNCGQRLVAAGVSSTVERPGTPEGTMACPRCGTHNRAGVAFCQNCGANLRGTAEGYVPPTAAEDERAAAAEPARRGAVLGPVVLLIGLAGLITGYLLPFLYGARDALFDRAWGADGYGVAFWNGYPEVNATLADQAYFGLAGPVPILGLLLLALAVAGFVRAAPGPLQSIGLVVALLWSVGLIVLFVIVELLANWNGDLVGVLRVLTPAGIIFFLSSLIVLIGTLTRFSRS